MVFSRTKGWIGVDLGTHTVKLAQVERRSGRSELVESLVIRRLNPIAADAEEETASSDEIRAALSLGENFSGHDAAVVLPMAVCDVRGCQVEERAEPRDAVLNELDSVYGDTETTRQFGYWSLQHSAETASPAENTLALSVPTFWTDRVAQDMTETKLVGHVLDGLPLAMARAVAMSSPVSAGPIAAVDWGRSRATLCAVLGGRPLFVRCLRDSGFSSVVSAVCQRLGINDEEAHQLLHEHGFPSSRAGVASDLQCVIEEVTRDALGAFLQELNRTLGFLQHQRRELAPVKVMLFGGGATVNNVAAYLDDKLELPVETWRLKSAARGPRDTYPSIELLGPAIALSALAWTTA
jgi:Tfp pilus assembly PilM family ATPase